MGNRIRITKWKIYPDSIKPNQTFCLVPTIINDYNRTVHISLNILWKEYGKVNGRRKLFYGSTLYVPPNEPFEPKYFCNKAPATQGRYDLIYYLRLCPNGCGRNEKLMQSGTISINVSDKIPPTPPEPTPPEPTPPPEEKKENIVIPIIIGASIVVMLWALRKG